MLSKNKDNLNNNKFGKNDTEDKKANLKSKENHGNINQQFAGQNLTGGDYINNPSETQSVIQIIKEQETLRKEQKRVKLEIFNCKNCLDFLNDELKKQRLEYNNMVRLQYQEQDSIRMGNRFPINYQGELNKKINNILSIEQMHWHTNCEIHKNIIGEISELAITIGNYQKIINNFGVK